MATPKRQLPLNYGDTFMKTWCKISIRRAFVTFIGALLLVGTWYPTLALATCNVTSNGSGSVGRITKFTPSSCSIGNSVITESSGKIGIGTTAPAATLDVHGGGVIRGATGIGAPASGGFEFEVSAPNQIGLSVEGPASGVGAGLQLITTGSGGLDWEILDTGSNSAQGADKLNIRNVNEGHDVFTIRGVDGAIGINATNPGAFQLDVVTLGGNGGISVSAAASTAIAANNSNGDAILATNDSLASTLGVQNSTTNTTAALADFLAPNTTRLTSSENGCVIDTLGDLTCTGTISGGTPIASASPLSTPHNRLASAESKGQYVKLSSLEAASQWSEDFGSARLVHGVASVALDPDFARTLGAGGAYHVFFTPKADCKGLYVARETSAGFEVYELGGGRSTLEFDYRVVGRHKLYRPIRASTGADLAKAAVSSQPAS
jgi:hypothetical protein